MTRLGPNQIETGLFSGNTPYIRAGDGTNEAVVLFGANALFKRIDTAASAQRYALQVARLLPAGFRFTILGYQETPPEQYSLATIVHDVEQVVKTHIGHAHVVIGISFGGFVAQRFVAECPELVDRLILLVTAHRFSANGEQLLQGQFKALESADFYQLARDNAVLFRRPVFNWLVRWKLWRQRTTLSAQFKDAGLILRAYRGIFSNDFTRNAEFAKRITAPALIIGGGADQYFDLGCMRETANLIAGSRLKVFQGETHMLPVERRRDVAAEISRFLEGSGPVS